MLFRSHVDAGAYGLRRETIEQLPPGRSALEQGLFPQLAAGEALAAFDVPQRFYEIGTMQRIVRAERFLA